MLLRFWSLLLVVFCCTGLVSPLPAIPSGSESTEADENHHEEGEEWTYEEQQLWPEQFADCGGPRQSPTRLDAELLELGSRPQLSFAAGLADGRVHASNTGHTLQLRLSVAADAEDAVCADVDTCAAGGDRSVPLLTLSAANSPLSGTYQLEQLHFHWGDSHGTPGSEHALDGRVADAEAHLVFFNIHYGNISEAARHESGLAVLGILLEASEPDLSRLTWPSLGLKGRLAELAQVGSELTVPADLTPLQPLLQQAVGRVLSYSGSLTTPPCSPVVRWLVALRPVPVDADFLQELTSSLYRDRSGRQLLQNNRRYLQLRRDRLVIKHVSFDGW